MQMMRGGGGGIRTPGTLSGPTVFKTAGFNRSPTPPFRIVPFRIVLCRGNRGRAATLRGKRKARQCATNLENRRI